MSENKATVLVVDDNIDICEILKEWLEEDGYIVDIAHSGNKAFLKMQKKQYDALISDVKMPDGTGVDLLNAVNTLEVTPRVKVIMTGFSDVDESYFIELGATHFYKKPVKLEIISEILDNEF